MNLFAKSGTGVFASASLAGHLIRGAAAAALIACALSIEGTHPAIALLAGAAGMLALRGCPICWAVGLAETIAQRSGITTAGSRAAR
ncbi:MAG TPA: hypothetical protein VKI18_01410 [Albitalea sp.]|nr:hypothetical protein [Albitalea sp.]